MWGRGEHIYIKGVISDVPLVSSLHATGVCALPANQFCRAPFLLLSCLRRSSNHRAGQCVAKQLTFKSAFVWAFVAAVVDFDERAA